MNFVTLLQNQAAASVGSFKKPTFQNFQITFLWQEESHSIKTSMTTVQESLCMALWKQVAQKGLQNLQGNSRGGVYFHKRHGYFFNLTATLPWVA